MSDAGADLEAMSVKQLKRYILTAGLDLSGCVEKSDLRERAREAQARFAADPTLGAPAQSARGLWRRDETLAGFQCLLCGMEGCAPEQGAPDLLVLLMHGFGATNADFADIPEMFSAPDAGFEGKKVAFVFPQAKIGAIGVPEWWPIDVERWIMSRFMGPQGLEMLVQETPPGLDAAREELGGLINEALELFGGLSYKNLALGGFSQGAMTALSVALHMPKVADAYLGGCFLLSGAPIGTATWTECLAADEGAKGVPIFMSHGSQDEVLPIQGAEMCQERLVKEGFSVDFVRHNGGHTLGPTDVIGRFLGFLRTVLQNAATSA